jgi:transposase
MKPSSKLPRRAFTATDRRRLSQALLQADTVALYRRIQAVWLVAQGRSVKEAAVITAQTDRSVRRLVRRYLRSHAVRNLADRPRSGRPRVGRPISESRLARLLNQSPLRLGYRTNVWTCAALAHRLTRLYGQPVSARTVRRRLHALDYGFKRPRYVYAEKDSHRTQKKGPSCGI